LFYELNGCTIGTSYNSPANTPQTQKNAEHYTKDLIYTTEDDLFLA
jgi:hypothetical protein